VNKIALGQVLGRGLRCSPVTIIPSMFHTHLHFSVDEEQTGGFWESSKKLCFFFGIRVALDKKVQILTDECQVILAIVFFRENLPSFVCDQ